MQNSRLYKWRVWGGTNLALYSNVQYYDCMLASHRIALAPTNKQKTLFRQLAGYSRVRVELGRQ